MTNTVKINEINTAQSLLDGARLLGVTDAGIEKLFDYTLLKGERGVGIRSISHVLTDGVMRVTITLTDNTQTSFDIQNGRDGANGEKGEKGDKGDKGDDCGITAAQAAWVTAKMQAELGTEANARLTLAQTNTPLTRYADTDAAITVSTTVTVKFDGANVQPDNHDAIVAAGWSNSATGVYTKELTGASGSIAAQAFTYTPQSGTYQGITVSKSSAAKTINVVYPSWYGFVDSATFDNSRISELTRIVSNRTDTADLTNTLQTSGYFWILTHNSATATQLGSNILNAPQTVTINIGGFTLTNYKLYISTNSAAAGGKFGDVVIRINI